MWSILGAGLLSFREVWSLGRGSIRGSGSGQWGELAWREALTLVGGLCSTCDPLPLSGWWFSLQRLEDNPPGPGVCLCHHKSDRLVTPGLSSHHGLVKVTPPVSPLMQ